MKKKNGFKNLKRFIACSLALVFILSLGLHNHAFYLLDSSLGKVSKSESLYPGHSKEFCSACRLGGNLKPQKTFIGDLGFFGIFLVFLNLDVLIPSLHLSVNKSPRSPPVFGSYK